MQRYTFVVRVHPGNGSVVENLATHEQAPVTDLTRVGPQIERWLEELKERPPTGALAPAQEEEQA